MRSSSLPDYGQNFSQVVPIRGFHPYALDYSGTCKQPSERTLQRRTEEALPNLRYGPSPGSPTPIALRLCVSMLMRAD